MFAVLPLTRRVLLAALLTLPLLLSATSAAHAATYSQEVLADNPWSFYQLEDPGSSALTDSSANNRPGSAWPEGLDKNTAAGATTSDGPSKGALTDTSTYLRANTTADVTDFAADFWFNVNHTEVGSFGRIFSFNSSAGEGYLVYGRGYGLVPKLGVYVGDGSMVCCQPETTDLELDDGLWHHIALSRDSATQQLKVYVDGVEAITVAATAVNFNGINPSWGSANGGYWQNDLLYDELAFYDHTLTPARIQAHIDARGPLPSLPAATDTPQIDGVLEETRQLTADEGAWDDPSTSFTYSWQTSADGAVWADEDNERTQNVHTAFVGKHVRLRMRVTNAAGSKEVIVGPTAPVAKAKPYLSGYGLPPYVYSTNSGYFRDGEKLRVANQNFSWTGSDWPFGFARTLERCDAGGDNCAEISAGYADDAYTLGVDDIGHRFKSVVTVSNSAGSTVYETALSAVVAGTPPQASESTVVTGQLKEGQLLTAVNNSWAGTAPLTFTYEWHVWGRGVVATGSSYRLTAADVGSDLRVRMTATNSYGSSEMWSAWTPVVTAGPPVQGDAPALSGDGNVDGTLTATAGTWYGTATIAHTFQWQRETAPGVWTDIAGADQAAYTLTEADAGLRVRAQVTATNGHGASVADSAASAFVGYTAPAVTADPELTGTERDGETLTAAGEAFSGSQPVTVTRQWQRETAPGVWTDIPGADQAAYTLAPADIGQRVRVRVTAVNPGGTAAATSDPSGVIAAVAVANTQLPAIDGAATEGETLSGDRGQFTGSPTISFTLSWLRCDAAGAACSAIPGAAAAFYTLAPADIGRTVRLQVTAANAAGPLTVQSAASPVIAASDVTAPDTALSATPARASNDRTAAFAFHAGADHDATFECRLDEAAWAGCTSPRGLTGLTDGKHRFQVRATDKAGNTDASPAVYAWVVDTTPPQEIKITPPVNDDGVGTPVDGGRVVIEFSGGDDSVSFECSLNGAPWERCKSPLTFENLPDGEHELKLRAIDEAGNVAEQPPVKFRTRTVQLVNTDAPTLRKTGGTVTCRGDQWSKSTITRTYTWRRNGRKLGHGGAEHKLTRADRGKRLSCQIDAVDGEGRRAQTFAPHAVVQGGALLTGLEFPVEVAGYDARTARLRQQLRECRGNAKCARAARRQFAALPKLRFNLSQRARVVVRIWCYEADGRRCPNVRRVPGEVNQVMRGIWEYEVPRVKLRRIISSARKGENAFALTGRLPVKLLRPGRYKVTARILGPGKPGHRAQSKYLHHYFTVR